MSFVSFVLFVISLLIQHILQVLLGNPKMIVLRHVRYQAYDYVYILVMLVLMQHAANIWSYLTMTRKCVKAGSVQ